tara:strand:- start:238 stop:1890 length:1653 start_codon:yes stop_codon:yes gene_type:complete
VRTNDIEEVGDATHLTFFEMLGNWSLGDYFKTEQIEWVFTFLTDKESGLGLDPNRMYVSVFEGNEDAPRDDEAYKIWQQFIPKDRIYFMGAEDNWWSAGDNGPCGPDSEIFYDLSRDGLGVMSFEEFKSADDRQDVVEICNSVFMQYLKEGGKVTKELENKNIDFGSGLERLVAVVQGKTNPYETDMFAAIISLLEEKTGNSYAEHQQAFRIIADHIRSSMFMIADGLTPSNKDAGYILRRLLRRATMKMKEINFDPTYIDMLINAYLDIYDTAYPSLETNKERVIEEMNKEIQKFSKTLEHGLREFEKITDENNDRDNIAIQQFGQFNTTSTVNELSGHEAFTLFTTYGFPIELIQEESAKRGLHLDRKGFDALLAEHQEQSRSASAGKFKGGMAGDSPKITALHSATHLMLAALRKELGDHVQQAGSNITEERTRFDFTHPEKVEREILDRVEQYVNDAIAASAKMTITEMPKQQAMDEGVVGSFWEKYPDTVKVYAFTDSDENVWSRELCGGPHVENTSEIGTYGSFTIKKEESSSAGVRRIKAVLA